MNKTLHRALDLFYRTACLEKNYRLQDIQLSKSSLSYRVMPVLQARRLREKSIVRSRRLQTTKAIRTTRGDPALRRFAKLVENTGLEPVTSWLQTRRSPS